MIDSRLIASQGSMELWIIRHADAAPAPADGRDFERPLSARGVADCARLRAFLEQSAPRVDRIVASDALRARTTAELLAPAFGGSAAAIELDHRIYSGGADALLDLIRETPVDISGLVIVGHNPGISVLVSRLLVPEWRRGLPTLGTVCARCESPWSKLADSSVSFERYLDPTSLD